MIPKNEGTIYSATYSNVPVYEFGVDGNHVMRRRSDDYINATHILKVAEYDKPTRTRILEREVQKGIHEKVQGGYGKYQGTWIPLPDGRELAIKNNVFEKLKPMFDFVPGDKSPPPAPKHATAASTKPRAPRAPAQPRRQAAHAQPDYDAMDTNMRDQDTPDNVTIASESVYEDYEAQLTGSRKRRRVEDTMSQADKEFRLWADDLLDYFILQNDAEDSLPSPPFPPPHTNLNHPIDNKGHTALHWAAAMGDLEVMKDLIRRGAAVDIPSRNGETPLMRTVMFTNSHDHRNMDKLAGLLIRTVNMQDWSGKTVFHYIAESTSMKSKYQVARYYMDALLDKMGEILSPAEVEQILNFQDTHGDTAITIAARHGARKCVRSLIGRNAAVDIPNAVGDTADQFIVALNHRRQERANNRQLSSSPFQADGNHHGAALGGAVQPPNGLPFDPRVPNGHHSGSNGAGRGDVYKSEAALAVTAQIMPVIVDKAKALAWSLDEEMAEKDAELREAERVAAMRRAERDALKKTRDELLAKEMEEANAEAETEAEELRNTLARLEGEVKDLTEQEEEIQLRRFMDGELAKQGHVVQSSAQDLADEAVRDRLRIARELVTLQRSRIDLTRRIVHDLGVQGYGGQQDAYRRLISGALNVKQADVEDMLPDVVSELEESKALDSVGA